MQTLIVAANAFLQSACGGILTLANKRFETTFNSIDESQNEQSSVASAVT